MKNWIVSKTFSETVVKFYWTINDNVKCHAMIWVNSKKFVQNVCFSEDLLHAYFVECIVRISCSICDSVDVLAEMTKISSTWSNCSSRDINLMLQKFSKLPIREIEISTTCLLMLVETTSNELHELIIFQNIHCTHVLSHAMYTSILACSKISMH